MRAVSKARLNAAASHYLTLEEPGERCDLLLRLVGRWLPEDLVRFREVAERREPGAIRMAIGMGGVSMDGINVNT